MFSNRCHWEAKLRRECFWVGIEKVSVPCLSTAVHPPPLLLGPVSCTICRVTRRHSVCSFVIDVQPLPVASDIAPPQTQSQSLPFPSPDPFIWAVPVLVARDGHQLHLHSWHHAFVAGHDGPGVRVESQISPLKHTAWAQASLDVKFNRATQEE